MKNYSTTLSKLNVSSVLRITDGFCPCSVKKNIVNFQVSLATVKDFSPMLVNWCTTYVFTICNPNKGLYFKLPIMLTNCKLMNIVVAMIAHTESLNNLHDLKYVQRQANNFCTKNLTVIWGKCWDHVLPGGLIWRTDKVNIKLKRLSIR